MIKNLKRLLIKPQRYFSEITGVLLLILGIYFIRLQGSELRNVGTYLRNGNTLYVLIGSGITLVYIWLQALMYQSSFKAVGLKVSIYESAILFLKRNLISIFLPGGGITSLAFFTGDIQKEANQTDKTKIHLASTIYGFTGILSIVVIALPVLGYLIFNGESWQNANQALALLIFFMVLLGYIAYSFFNKGWIYRWSKKFIPQINSEFKTQPYFKTQFYLVNFYAILIDVVGVFHLYLAMMVMGADASLKIALVGYVIATLLLVISPFLRGIGAIEFSLVLILKHYGFPTSEALAITIIYRFFEFWLPILGGLFSFILLKGNMLLRVIPALLLFVLGLINIVSVLTPSLNYRLKLLEQFIPTDTINASNYLVFILGLLLIVTSTFLFRGLKNAWLFAVLLCTLSLIGNITKAIDYEESIVAFVVLLVLWFTRKQYYIKHNKKLQMFSIETSILILGAVIIYGVIGFYFLDARHFHHDFTLSQSINYTLLSFVLLDIEDLKPVTHFAAIFLDTIRISGVVSLVLIAYAMLKPYFFKSDMDDEDYEKGLEIIKKFGKSPVDYFKVYNDKLLYFGVQTEGLVSYRAAGSFAIVLEEPVCQDKDQKIILIKEFEEYCSEVGLRAIYYRVDECSLALYQSLNKKSLIIGQEAVIDLSKFTLEGKDKKSMRNGLNSLSKKGFSAKVYAAPIKDGLLQKLKQVSDEWLKSNSRDEIVFTQGVFDAEKLKQQTIITIENEDEMVLGFLNIIPNYAPEEATYDLIRKTEEAPGGVIDALLIKLIEHCQSENIKFLNLGLAPLSGIETARDFPEKTLKFAYEKLQQFRHYRGLRDFKDKFNPTWENKYMIYQNHYDLLQLPNALNKVMKP
jgi:phosphatidylglycerol lysyltransferase